MHEYANGRRMLAERIINNKSDSIGFLCSNFLTWLLMLGLSYLLALFGVSQPLTFFIIIMVLQLIPSMYKFIAYKRHGLYTLGQTIGYIIGSYVIVAILYPGLTAIFAAIFQADFFFVFLIVSLVLSVVETILTLVDHKVSPRDSEDLSAEEAFYLMTGHELSEIDPYHR